MVSKRLMIALALGALLCSVQLAPSKADEETDALGEDEPEDDGMENPDDPGGGMGGDDYGGGMGGMGGMGGGDYGGGGGYGDDYGGGGGEGGGLADNIKGFVDLDDLTFSKIVDGSRNVFVVFYSPWDPASKDMVPELMSVGEEIGAQDNLLLVKVNAEENEALKAKFGLPEELPVIMSAAKGAGKEAKDYKKFEGEKSADVILDFLEETAGAPGTVPELAAVVDKFMKAPSAAGIKEAEKAVATLGEAEEASGAYYVKAMGKVVSKGKEYPKTESERLLRMIDGASLRAEKVKEFKNRINALRAFDSTIPKPPRAKPEEEEMPEDAEGADADEPAADDKTEL